MQIEILCGPQTTQIVRAVIPVPEQSEGTWYIDDVPAQADVVSRRWNSTPDTVEVIARVPTKNVGGYATYNVTFQADITPPPTGEFGNLPSITAEVIDEQGRSYNFFKIKRTILQDGAYKRVTELAGVLRRNDGLSLLGVVFYATQFEGETLFDLDTDFNNALVEQVIGNVYIKSLSVTIGDNYRLFPKVGSARLCGQLAAETYYVGRPDSYFIVKQAGFHRRFVATKTNDTDRRYLKYRQAFGCLGFCLEWNDSFGVAKTGLGPITNDYRYYAQDGLAYYGREGFKRKGKDDYNAIRIALATGHSSQSHSIYSTALGLFHPYFLNDQGSPGGNGIQQYIGYGLCIEEYMAWVCIAGMNADRQPWNAYYNDGRPKTDINFATEGGGIIQFDSAPFDFGLNGIPAFIHAGDFNAGSASRDIEQWAPHDSSHQCRYNKPIQAIAFLGNDWLAKRHLEMAAEVDMLYLNLFPQVHGWAGGMNLTKMLTDAHHRPGQGGLMGRTRCWPIDAIMAYFAVASPDWRDRITPWIQKMAECLIVSQMPTGWNTRHPADSHDQVITTAALPLSYDVGQTFEIEFEDWIKRCLWINMEPGDRSRNGLMLSNIHSATSLFLTPVYNGHVFKWFVANGHNQGNALSPSELAWALTSQEDEIFQGWYVLNHAYLAAQELQDTTVDWLDVALGYRLAAASPAAKISQLNALASEEWNNHLVAAMGLMHSLSLEE